MLEPAEREDVDPVGHQRVDEGIAGQHVLDHPVVERIAMRGQVQVELREFGQDRAERRLDRVQVQARGSPGGNSGQLMRSTAARDREETSGGSAMYPRSRLKDCPVVRLHATNFFRAAARSASG